MFGIVDDWLLRLTLCVFVTNV